MNVLVQPQSVTPEKFTFFQSQELSEKGKIYMIITCHRVSHL